jgi:imidazolonepropionase-like amidohydrolase
MRHREENVNMARHGWYGVAVTIGLLFAATVNGEVRILKGFTLLDGTGRPPMASAAMIVDNGRITWVGPAAQLKRPAGADAVDLSGRFVMPGIINLHGHIGNTVDLKQDAKFYTRESVQKNLATYASYGVTTVLSLGTDQDLIFKIREEQRAGRPAVARVYTAGQGFVFKGGYGGLEGVTPGVATPAEATEAVGVLARKGVDIVKLWMDDHLGAQKKMPYEIAKAIIDGAHKHHLPVAAHIFYLEDARRLVEYGVNGLAHSVRDKDVDEALIRAMKKQGTWQIAATLTREASMFIYADTPAFAGDPFFTRSVSAGVVETLRSPAYQKSIASDPHFDKYRGFLETAKRNLKTLADAGVQYGFGTDTGPPGRFPGFFEQWELQLMAEAGLTPMQVIVAATGSAARFLGSKDLGTLEAGKWADLIVLDRNPLQDIRNTRAIRSVYIAGNRVQ